MNTMHLTGDEVAQRLHMSTKTLANWRVSGEGPRFIKAGRRILDPMPEIEAWEQSRLVRSTSEAWAKRA